MDGDCGYFPAAQMMIENTRIIPAIFLRYSFPFDHMCRSMVIAVGIRYGGSSMTYESACPLKNTLLNKRADKKCKHQPGHIQRQNYDALVSLKEKSCKKECTPADVPNRLIKGLMRIVMKDDPVHFQASGLQVWLEHCSRIPLPAE